jgi:signal transduction histidine kinase
MLLIGVLLVERQQRRRGADALRTANVMLTDTMAEIKDLSGRLMSAQEDERRRISRQLHDDVSQQIALIGVRLSTLKRSISDPVAIREHLTVLRSDVMRLADSIHTLSHELHPALLERASLPTALRAYLEEFGGLHGVRIHFDEALVRVVPHDVSLCLYRITQEALRNVVRHSGVKEAWVSLGDVDGHIELSVRDSGRGFDPHSVRGTGIGLASMKERARTVGGMVLIDSRVGGGTTTRVSIPVSETVGANA